MGIDPQEVKHLKLAEQQRLGVINPSEIEIRGESLDEVAVKFELPSTFKRQ